MPKEFLEHIENFMIERPLLAKYAKDLDGIIPYMQQQFELEQRQNITHLFVIQCFAEYSKTSVDEVMEQLKQERPRRKGVNYTPIPSSKPSSCGNIMSVVAEHGSPEKFAVEVTKGETPKKEAFKKKVSSNAIIRTPSQFMHNNHGTFGTNNNTPYKPIITTSNATLFKQVKPPKAIKFNLDETDEFQMQEEYPQLYNTSDNFEFTVTKSQLISRLNTKRRVTQKQVMGFTAEEIFLKFGAVIKRRKGKSDYHLAHRHGWGLGGAQRGINLDVGTAGSNYHTLFCVEDPIRQLLMSEENPIEEVLVKGEVVFREGTPIPEKITYRLFWADQCQYEYSIYPTDHNKPTMSENVVATACLETLTDYQHGHSF